VKLLIASFAPLRPESGAGQLALGLGAALAARGHEVVTWQPSEPPERLRSRLHTGWRRMELERFVCQHGPFDAVDAPPVAVSRRLTRSAPAVVRTVQPDWLYWRTDFADACRTRDVRSALMQFAALGAQVRVFAGVLAARRVVCLGPQEEAWLRRWLPVLGDRLVSYDGAPSDADREALKSIRAVRRTPTNSMHWLWIGRLSPHKAPERALRWFEQRLRIHSDDRLTFAGCGDLSAGNIPPALRRNGRIHFVPRYSRADLPGLLAAHDVGLFTSIAEGWGLSLQEMLESGMPVFATDAGCSSLLRGYFPDGLHPFPPPLDWNVRGWALARPKQAYWQRFSWSAIAARYERDILRGLVRGGSEQ
jgi:glycosyltransferase involved in cell wall biosynthesis